MTERQKGIFELVKSMNTSADYSSYTLRDMNINEIVVDMAIQQYDYLMKQTEEPNYEPKVFIIKENVGIYDGQQELIAKGSNRPSEEITIDELLKKDPNTFKTIKIVLIDEEAERQIITCVDKFLIENNILNVGNTSGYECKLMLSSIKEIIVII